MQNIHRYFLYLGVFFLVILAYDAIDVVPMRRRHSSASASARSSWRSTSSCWAATRFGCHSLRHLIGGRKDEISNNALQLALLQLRVRR